MGFHSKNRVISLTFLAILQNFGGASRVTAISTYNSHPVPVRQIEPSEGSFSQQISASSSPISSSSQNSFAAGRKEFSGNVIFRDNIDFSSSGPTQPENGGSGNKRKKSLSHQEQNSEYNHHHQHLLAGGHLKNHRLVEEEGEEEQGHHHNHISPLSTTDVASASAAAVVSSAQNFYNDQVNENSHQNQNVHRSTGAGASIVEGGSGSGGVSRALLSSPYSQFGGGGGGSQHGWASNPGSCLFSCSGGSFGGGAAVSCCQQNYVQCCPNPQQETLNFKNLHHGRGHFGGIGGGGNFGKIGHAWGAPPFSQPPIIRKPCQPFPFHHPGVVSPVPIVHGAGALIHKGVETIKSSFHNIGHLFKDHLGGGGAGGIHGGWGSGGNGAAGYYFHRRSDNKNDNNFILDARTNHSPQKRRLTRRSLQKSFDQHHHHNVQPCPVYSTPPNLGGWHSRPPSVGLGSLIGWTKPPVNHIQTEFLGGGGSVGFGGSGYGHAGLYPQQQHIFGGGGVGGGYGHGHGWGSSVGRGFCKWDYECPGNQKCCKGACQLTPFKK